jgi:hypothetical protein
MGQSQLLIVLLGVFLIGVAIYFGLTAFTASATESARSAIINDLGAFSSAAVNYYWKPTTQGGGGKSFKGMMASRFLQTGENPNGRYFIESASDEECLIMGVGRVMGDNGDSIRVRSRVTLQRNRIEILN